MFLPRTCVVCGRHLTPDEDHLCLECLSDIPLTRFWTLERNPMADRFNASLTAAPEEPYCYALALFNYNSESGWRHVTPALKYRGDLSVGRYFAGMLADRLALCPWLSDVDLVVPVPLHWRRCLQRGYNQAGIIAEVVAARMGAGLDARLLRRVRYSRSQTRTGVALKRENVSGAFAVRATSAGAAHPVQSTAWQQASRRGTGAGAPEPRHILLIDDVCTTGSTLGACHDALRGVFSSDVRISAATLAFVVPA